MNSSRIPRHPRIPGRAITASPVARLLLTMVPLLACAAVAPAQGREAPKPRLTVEHPVAVRLSAPTGPVAPGASSELTLRFLVPEGFWVGAADGEVRSPGRTVVVEEPSECFAFEAPRWPAPSVEGIPVKLGTTRVYKGEITVAVPFRVRPDCPVGAHTAALRVTYTPGLNAGHLTPHVGEKLAAEVRVEAGTAREPSPVTPRVQPAPGLHVEPVDRRLPGPLEAMRFDVPEETGFARLVHRVWQDHPGHGKSVQGFAYPFASSGINSGSSWGVGIGIVDTTREGIGTGAVNVRAFHNEYVGDTVALDVLSCPAAFHNFWLSAFAAEDDTTHGATFHVENLTRSDGKWGYEASLQAFEDGRYRYYGLGAGAREEAETAYAQRQVGGTVDLFWNAATNWRFGGGVRYADVDVRQAASRLLDETTSIFDGFPAAPGIGGGSVVAPRLSIVFDRRNQEFTPTHGALARATLEHVELDGNDDGTLAGSWDHWTVDGRWYASPAGQRSTLLLRGQVDEVSDRNVPFWELPSLGGEANLRAYGEGRFRGEGAFFGSVELRVQALHWVVMGMPIDVELAPFVDLGRVYDGALFGKRFFDEGFNVDPGLSVRILNRPNVGLVLNWAEGRDGSRFTGGVSLPL